jgi:tetratricopeptide (TPR) repeat protein
MKRVLTIPMLFLVWWAGPALGQNTDSIEYLDAMKKKAEVVGVIQEETPAGIKIKERNEVKLIPALAVTQVTYRHAKLIKSEFRHPFTSEFKAGNATKQADKIRLLGEALLEFEQLAKDVKDTPNAYRYVQFKVALVKVHLAQLEPDNKARLATALAAMAKYKDDFPNGWEIVPCLTTLAKLYEEQSQPEKARETYEALLLLPDVPKEIRREGDLLVAQMMVRGKQYLEAEKKLKSLSETLAADDPQRTLVQVYLVETQIAQDKLDQVQPALNAILDSSSDPRVRATAHNYMGDFYRKKKQDDEAVWHYLKVDVLYSEDKDQHAKALYYLYKLFDSAQGNKVRSQQCLERLTDKAFDGNEFYRMARAEKPSTTP